MVERPHEKLLYGYFEGLGVLEDYLDAESIYVVQQYHVWAFCMRNLPICVLYCGLSVVMA